MPFSHRNIWLILLFKLGVKRLIKSFFILENEYMVSKRLSWTDMLLSPNAFEKPIWECLFIFRSKIQCLFNVTEGSASFSATPNWAR